MFGNAISNSDPFILHPFSNTAVNTNGLSHRSQVINPGLKTLVLIGAGQSNWTDVNPTIFIPTNTATIDQFSICDGGSYSINGPLLGCTDTPFGAGTGGNPLVRVADNIRNRGTFDRVIIVPIAIGGTTVSQWGLPAGILFNQTTVAMLRLASRGITPSTPGVTFAMIWGQGENDTTFATTQADYTTGLNGLLAQTAAAGFVGRTFVLQESWIAGVTSAAVRAAQAASWNGTTVFNGGDMDTLTAASRQADNLHLNDTGAAAVATLVEAAMHASGAPF